MVFLNDNVLSNEVLRNRIEYCIYADQAAGIYFRLADDGQFQRRAVRAEMLLFLRHLAFFVQLQQLTVRIFLRVLKAVK